MGRTRQQFPLVSGYEQFADLLAVLFRGSSPPREHHVPQPPLLSNRKASRPFHSAFVPTRRRQDKCLVPVLHGKSLADIGDVAGRQDFIERVGEIGNEAFDGRPAITTDFPDTGPCPETDSACCTSTIKTGMRYSSFFGDVVTILVPCSASRSAASRMAATSRTQPGRRVRSLSDWLVLPCLSSLLQVVNTSSSVFALPWCKYGAVR